MPPNRFERQRGYTRTETGLGKVRITKLLKKHHERALELELTARNVPFDPKETWTKKKQRLVENEKHSNNEEDARYFKPRTSLAAFAAPL